jgi:hypothetical protein
MTIPNDPFGTIKPDKKDSGVPDARTVNAQHTKSDVDSSLNAQHHTLGIKRNQGASGRHNHAGNDSVKIGHGMNLTITGAKGGNAALTSLLATLAKVIEFTDTTT